MLRGFLFMAKNYMDAKEKEGQTGDKNDWGFCKGRFKWAEKRAVIVKLPEEPLVGEPGQTIFAEVHVQNQTKWPWKKGIIIGLAKENEPEPREGEEEKKESTTKTPFIVRDFPVDQEVFGMATIVVQIPIEIPSDFNNNKESDPSEVYEVPLTFYGPKGSSFGQRFTIKVQVQEGEKELALFKAAMTLAEAGMGSFDECVEAYRACNMDEGAALQMLLEKQQQTSQ
mmetsp:Transcript_4915/g.3516  ORF Transcript_4915/g.3516 Transcript_4915/m.3516 type:complete len:226 (+) Transcript_4915:1432-2109(+)